MPKDANGRWYPNLFNRQLEVFNCRARALLVCGPRLSGKTWVVLHRVVRHLWETVDARVAMFSRTLKNSKDGGTWPLLHRVVLKEWINAGIGMRYTTVTSEGIPGPKVDGQTRTPYFRIRNAHGGESELLLFSLDHDGDVEDKLKEMEFSMIYFSELTKFGDRKILSVALPSLRMPHLRFEDQMWIADTNPGEEGEGSWIYNVWYRERKQTYEEYCVYNKKLGNPVLPEESFLDFQKNLDLIEIKPEENPFLDPRQLKEIKTTYGYDPGLYARYVEGKWIYGDGDSSRHFRAFFRPNLHVIGNCEAVNEEDWICALPSENCFELVTGWDLGDTNHAACILEKIIINNKSHWVLLDELVSIRQEVSIDTFTEAFMEQVEALEAQQGHKFNLDRSYSDRSSLEKYNAAADTYEYLLVHAASKERIYLQAAPKPHGSVRVRVRLLKQFLAQGRFKVSAHCKYAITMLKDLKKGDGALNYVVPDQNKHIFDAITYALLMECAEELIERGHWEGKREALIVHV